METIHQRFAALDDEPALVALLVPFFVVFLVCAIALQVWSGEAPATSGTITDRCSAGLLWAASIVAVMIAARLRGSMAALLGWIVVSAGAGALAIDEVMEIHERTVDMVGEDDYAKILMWMAAVAVVWIMLRFARPSRYVRGALLVGLALHTAYLLTDMGDGDFFQIPLTGTPADWLEEILEILALEAYLAALLLHLTAINRAEAKHDQMAEKPV